MIPGFPRILTCPHCGAEKQVLSLVSGNTFGQTVWSDNKTIAPMLLRPSFVQKCPQCGGYFLLSRQTDHRFAIDGHGWDKGDLTYEQLKEAYASFKGAELSDDERQTILLYLLWAFNDTYTREEPKEIPDVELSYFQGVVNELLPLIGDPLLRAELYRELSDFDKASEELSKATNSEEWYLEIKESINQHIVAKDSGVFVLIQGR